ncbi:MAG: helix-hairpin-helix domain-containing protein, partial [Saprospiraceae bacterium]|nr:helix-hairpin-helix domain-containing protein [Saprospiraceae bacterium]
MTRHYLHLLIFLTLNLLCVSVSFGQDEDNLQNDNTQEDATWAQDLIEEYIQSNELGEEFDYNTFVDQLHYFFKHKLDLNYASFDDMNDLGLLSDIQINNIIEYRNNVGKLIVIYELQAIPTIDMTTIKRILPFVKVGGDLNDYQISIAKMMYKGKNDVFLRGRRYLEKQKGFLPVENPSDNHYLGDPYQFYARFKHTYENKLSYGITAEKDPGEEFFKGSNKQGFDFYSAHFFVKDYRKWLKAVAVGDFLVNMGQGLIHYDGFGSGKSAYVINIKKSGRTLQAFSSINEFNYQRGIGVTIAPIKNIEVTAFASIRKRDGNIVALTDTSDYEENVIVFTSLGISGLHRTALEIADEGAITQQSYGAVIKFKKNNLRINSNSLFENLSKPFNRAEQPYNQYQFSGTSILNTSIDYSYIYRNINFFGETALNFNNMSVASINGLIIGLDRKVDLA